jgi:hypothetical protein
MKRITHVDGIEVILQQEAYGVHPRWRDKQVVISGVTHLVLADEREVYVCNICGDIRDSVASVVGHMASHTERQPMYSAETIKFVIREVLRHDDRRNKCELAAAELNRKGVETLNGEKWYANTVSALYRKYKDEPAYKVRRPARPKSQVDVLVPRESAEENPVVIASNTTGPVIVNQSPSERQIYVSEPIIKRLLTFSEKLQDLVSEHEKLVADVVIALGETNIHPDIVEKAAKWDAAQALFGNNQ